MRTEFVWCDDKSALPVEIKGKDIEMVILDVYNELMRVKSPGVDLIVKSQVAWHIARSKYGRAIPQINCEKMKKAICCSSSCFYDSFGLYFSAMLASGKIGWFRSDGQNFVWGYEVGSDVIGSITGECEEKDEDPFIVKEDEKGICNASNPVVNKNDDPFYDPFLTPEYSSSASSEAETPFDAGEPVPAEKPADQPIPHRKSFLELIGRDKK